MKELFDIPEQLSPRLAWMKEHDVHTYRSPCMEDGDEPWSAWIGDFKTTVAHNDDYETGETEDEALVKLCKRNNLKLWNEQAAGKNNSVAAEHEV